MRSNKSHLNISSSNILAELDETRQNLQSAEQNFNTEITNMSEKIEDLQK
jgi:hypothetical protein